jgi:hypothetical protein
MNATATATEFRTPQEVRADEEIADWFERFLLIDATNRRTVAGIEDVRRQLADRDGETALIVGETTSPFVWNGKMFRIQRAVCRQGKAEVAVEPTNDDLEAELCRRIEGDKHHKLTYFQGFGFICFPEDHGRYRDFGSIPAELP